MIDWQPMETAPKDRMILVWHCHKSDPYYIEEEDRMTVYGYWSEYCKTLTDGPYMACFGGGFTEDLSGEGYGPWATYEDWWFVADINEDYPLAPIAWADVQPPTQLGVRP